MKKVRVKGKKAKEIINEIEKDIQIGELTEAITKQFEDGEWLQNEYWEYDDGVMCASFINMSLDQMSVFVDCD